MFEAGFVTYSNEAKTKLLHVSEDVIETFGSVSVAAAWAMAQGALAASGADVAVALTGIAGPAGGSDRKPVGTVVFARADKHADPSEITADTKKFDDNGRGGVRLQAALCALELLLPGRARPVERGGALLERADHPPQRAIEHLPGDRLEDAVAEGEIDAEIHLAPARHGAEFPAVVEIFERPIDIVDLDRARPDLAHPRGEGLAQRLEADDEVGDHLGLAVRADPRRRHPGQELLIAADVGDEVEQLLGRVGQDPLFGVARHQPRRGASFASRAARIFSKSSPA